MSVQKSESGFTIVELMIATSVFAIILLIALASFIQIGRMYYRGLSAVRTQETARKIIDDISREVQYSNSPIAQTGNTLCIGSKRYAFDLHKRVVSGTPGVNQAPHALQKDSPGSGSVGCPQVTSQADLNNPTELLEENMRLSKFSVTEVPDSDGALWTITVKVIFGEDDVLEGLNTGTGDSASAICQSATFIGGQFCAVSEVSTTIFRRLR